MSFVSQYTTCIHVYLLPQKPSLGNFLALQWLSGPVAADPLGSHGLQPARLLCPWDFSRQEYWSGLPFPSPNSPGLSSKDKNLIGVSGGQAFGSVHGTDHLRGLPPAAKAARKLWMLPPQRMGTETWRTGGVPGNRGGRQTFASLPSNFNMWTV